MKNILFWFRKKTKVMQIVATGLILCMGLADVSLYMRYASGQKDVVDDFCVVTEKHEMETALADGHYNGNGSDSENGDSNEIEIAEGKSLFNILEIYPTEKKAIIGYTIGGCEPFEVEEIVENGKVKVSKQTLRMAAMDALVNPKPGASDGNDQNIVNNYARAKYLKEMNSKLNENPQKTYPFTFEHSKTYDGYYKYVGNNKGFYRIDNPKTVNQKVESRFYSSGHNDYNYIFVYGEATSESRDVPVTAEKRIRYINNEKFIKDWLGESDVKKIKDKYVFEVTTRTPVTVTIEDIERADLILMNDAYKGDHFKFALELQNDLYGESDIDKDNGLHFYSPGKDGNVAVNNRIDFRNFEKVIKIYERVVVREDVAFVAEKTCCTEYYGGEIQKINTNIRKLMFMLFYVKQGNDLMAGRDVFTDFFKRYTDSPGETFGPDPADPTKTITYYEMRKRHLADPTAYPVDYRAASLKRNKANPDQPNYYYMHMSASYHVGHPLVIDKNTCITGAQTESVSVDTGNGTTTVTMPVLDKNGNIIPLHDADTIESRKLTIETKHPEMFTDAGFTKYNNQRARDEKKYYETNGISYYKYCYQSMSNTTDYIYIDNDGKLTVSTKYSSDQNVNDDYWNYWYKIDADFDPVDGSSTFRRRKWSAKVWDEEWPWDSSGDGGYLTEWLMHRKTEGYIYDCNMHMWYDYYAQAGAAGMKEYTTVKQPPFGTTYRNESLMEENGFFKSNWIKNALENRVIRREKTDANHIVNRTKKKYYISMNILNGDGVNNTNPAARNKVLYYNQYEKDDIVAYEAANTTISRIPINIRLKTSCKLLRVRVINDAGTVIANYDINSNPGNTTITSSSGGKTLELKPVHELDSTNFPKQRIDGDPDNTPIYSYEGQIFNVTNTYYLNKRNAKFRVEFTALLPDNKTEKTIDDEITIVKRDFFMLD